MYINKISIDKVTYNVNLGWIDDCDVLEWGTTFLKNTIGLVLIKHIIYFMSYNIGLM